MDEYLPIARHDIEQMIAYANQQHAFSHHVTSNRDFRPDSGGEAGTFI